MSSKNKALFICMLIFAGLAIPALSDRGMVPLADVSVYGPGQKAIIAWNGEEEVLILSTDVRADERTSILEVLPLPSNPDLIEKTNLSPFTAVQDLIGERSSSSRSLDGGKGSGIEVIFHDRIGAHDITVIKVDDSDAFEEWANLFLEERRVDGELDSSKLAFFIDAYIDRGMPYFVLDVIEVPTETRSVDPIIYRFKTDRLYFPLSISTLASGDSELAIFTISRGPVLEEDVPHPLEVGRYEGTLGRPVRFRVLEEDLERIDSRIWELFKSDAWLTAIRYSGPLKDLSGDLSIGEIRIPLGDQLVSSTIFWLGVGVALGIVFGVLLGHTSMGALRMDFWRLVAIIDFIGVLLLMTLASVMAYTWATYIFWLLVPVATACLYFSIRTGGRSILLIYLAIPFLIVALVLSIIISRTMESALALIALTGFILAAAFPPAGRRELTNALRRSSRWVVASTRKRRL